MCEGKWSEKEGSQRERDLGSAEAPGLLNPEKHNFVRTNGKEPELLEPIPYEFMAWRV